MAGLPDIDKELVIRAKQNDEQAIAEIIRQIDSQCYSIVYYCLKRNKRYVSDIEDIVQAAYTNAFTHMSSLKNNNFAPWMYTILERSVIDFTRSSYAKNKPSYFSEYDSDDFGEKFENTFENDNKTFEPEASVDYSELQKGLQEVMEQLPDVQRTAIYLRYIEKRKVSEIAEMYDTNENTVKSWLNYGRKSMKAIIEQLQKENKAFFGIGAIPFFVWMASKEVQRATPVQAAEIAHTIVQKNIPGNIPSNGSAPLKTFLATTKGKIVAGVVAASVAGSAGASIYYVYETSEQTSVEETVEEQTADNSDKQSDKSQKKDSDKKDKTDSNNTSKQNQGDSLSDSPVQVPVEDDVTVEVDGGTEEVYEDQTVDFSYVEEDSGNSVTINEGLKQEDSMNDFLNAGDSAD